MTFTVQLQDKPIWNGNVLVGDHVLIGEAGWTNVEQVGDAYVLIRWPGGMRQRIWREDLKRYGRHDGHRCWTVEKP